MGGELAQNHCRCIRSMRETILLVDEPGRKGGKGWTVSCLTVSVMLVSVACVCSLGNNFGLSLSPGGSPLVDAKCAESTAQQTADTYAPTIVWMTRGKDARSHQWQNE